MVDAVVGAAIMVVAATSLLFAVELSEKAFRGSGYYPLSSEEERVLRQVGLPEVEFSQFSVDNLERIP